jgi:hypothetical protein
MQETTSHILIHCNYVEPLWNAIDGHFNLPMINFREPVQWVTFLLQGGDHNSKRKKFGILFCFWWQIWKERNRQIFEGEERSINQVAAVIQEELAVHNQAHASAAADMA